jgi:DNA-binding transcriptional LysR family regulator
MDRDLLGHLPVILAVARRGSFAAAAKELGVTASNVSHAVKIVEDRLRTPLFARTTRSVSLTEAGDLFVAHARPAIEELQTAWELARAGKAGASGLLRINTSRVTLSWVMIPIVQAMTERFPDVTVELYFDDGLTDIVGEGFDAGIRLGAMVSEGMIGVRLAKSFRTIIAGAPAYLDRAPRLSALEDLARHNCIQYRLQTGGGLYSWDLSDGTKDIQVATRGTVVVNDMLQAVALAESGVGLCYTFEPLVRPHLESGRLRQVLPRTAVEEDGLMLYYPKRAALAPKLRAFIDTCRDVLRAGSA